MTVGIYGIFNAETDECLYIGQAANIESRWKQHKKLLRNKKHPRKDFVEWYHTNGSQSELLDFRILEECLNYDKTKNKLEIKWFKQLTPKFYGKEPSEKEVWQHSAATKDKIRESMRKKYFEVKCIRCESMFFSIDADKLCCRNCRYTNKSTKHYTKKSTYCKNCKKEKFTRNRFCSDECRKEFHNKKCLQCDKLIDKTRKFCSKDCYLLYPRKRLSNKPTTKGLIEYDDLYQMYVVEGMSTRQIALKTGYSNVSVQNWLRANNIPVKSNAQTISDSSKEKLLEELPNKDELLKYYTDRLSFDEIGKIYNTNRDKVRKWVKHYGFPSRKRPHRLR